MFSAFVIGGLIKSGICFINSLTPNPLFADILKISSSRAPIRLKICFDTFSMSTSIESTLLITGIMSRPASIAAYECANV